jgi:hypothetical protein
MQDLRIKTKGGKLKMAEKVIEYFSHDYRARTDPKILRLRKKHGALGLGVYWPLIEMLYEHEGVMPLCDIDSIAFELGVKEEIVNSVIRNFDLFEVDEETFTSHSVQKRLRTRKDKADKQREKANKRWNKDEKPPEDDTTAEPEQCQTMPQQCHGIATAEPEQCQTMQSKSKSKSNILLQEEQHDNNINTRAREEGNSDVEKHQAKESKINALFKILSADEKFWKCLTSGNDTNFWGVANGLTQYSKTDLIDHETAIKTAQEITDLLSLGEIQRLTVRDYEKLMVSWRTAQGADKPKVYFRRCYDNLYAEKPKQPDRPLTAVERAFIAENYPHRGVQ